MNSNSPTPRDRLMMSELVAKRCDLIDGVYSEIMGSINTPTCQSVRQEWLKNGPRANRFDGINVYIRLLGESIPSESTRRYFVDRAKDQHREYELSLTLPGRKRGVKDRKNEGKEQSRWLRFFSRSKADSSSKDQPRELDESLRSFVTGIHCSSEAGGQK